MTGAAPADGDLRDVATDAARQARAILDELSDPDSELTATAATRHRLEGVAIALDGVAAATPGRPRSGP